MKVYAPITSVALDWGIDNDTITNDLTTVQQQNYRVAAVPAMCNLPHMYCYKDIPAQLNLSWFDLVLISDIEYYSQSEIQTWIQAQGIKQYLLAIGGIKTGEKINAENTVYRPWWAYNCLRFNQYTDTQAYNKPFKFEMLLGARRPHRDFAMLSFQKANLLSSSIVTYRNIFQGHYIDRCSQYIADMLAPTTLEYPYVSPNLDPAWETSANLNFQISPYIPWEIYKRTSFSVLCETLGMSDVFFLSEKAAKVLFGKRLFVAFAPQYYLHNLRSLGFKTFDTVLDESYDLEPDYFKRYQQAFEQIQQLHKLSADSVLTKVSDVLEHNHQHLLSLQHQTKQQMLTLKQNHSLFC